MNSPTINQNFIMRFVTRDLGKMVRLVLHTECGDIPHVLDETLIPKLAVNSKPANSEQLVLTRGVYYSDLHPFVSATRTSIKTMATAGFEFKTDASCENDCRALFLGIQNPLATRPKHDHRVLTNVVFGGVGGRKFVEVGQLFDAALATGSNHVVLQIPAYYDGTLSLAAGHKKHAKCAERSVSLLETFLKHSIATPSDELSLFATIPFVAHAHFKQWKEFISSVNNACDDGTIAGLVIELQNEDAFGLSCSADDFTNALLQISDAVPSKLIKYLMGPMEIEKLLRVIKLSCVDYVDTSTATLNAVQGNLLSPLGENRSSSAPLLTLKSAGDKTKQDFLLEQLISPAKFGHFDCSCYVCSNYTVSYLAHLFANSELLGETLASIHNLNMLYECNNY